jgi:hypothetical protein
LYLAENAVVPPTLPNSKVEFRNKVIHQGHIPSEEAATGFGQAVVDMVQPMLGEMQERYGAAIFGIVAEHMRRAFNDAEADGKIGTMSYPMVYDLNPADDAEPKNLAIEVARRRSIRAFEARR